MIARDGTVNDVAWNGPAFKAGIAPGSTVIAVNSYALDGTGADLLKPALIAAEKGGAGPIELLIKADDRYRMVSIDYHGGLRNPRLESMGEGALLDKIAEPRE